eukprot:GFUD01021268.1.p1 GENE.GFUD01021268.1~~GFUD01021268.1.p1  ORF type:complete len:496 (+),score=153.04 GFUD01021268.1:85-1572(+)
MSDSLSPPSSCSNLVIDDDDLDSIFVTNEDLSAAEKKCGLVVSDQVETINKPETAFKPYVFSFGKVIDKTKEMSITPLGGSKSSHGGDPRTRYKPNFPSLIAAKETASGNSTATGSKPTMLNIKRTFPNTFGNTSFGAKLASPQPFTFGSHSQSIKEAQVELPSKFTFGSKIISPTPASPKSPDENTESKEDIELKKYILMEETQAEREKMLIIERMIRVKRMEQNRQETMRLNQQDVKMGWMTENLGNSLAMREIELQKQTTMVMQMQQNMLMEKRNTKEEKGRMENEKEKLENKKKILELQLSIQNLEGLLTKKQSSGLESSASRPVRERVGFRQSERAGGVMDRLGIKRGLEDFTSDGRGLGEEEVRESRKRRFMDGRSEEFDNRVYQGKKKDKMGNKYQCAKLPDDLVLTEITDQGPVKRENLSLREEGRIKREMAKREMKDEVEDEDEDDLDRYENQGELDPDLILTEFGENGPVKAGSVDITSTFGKLY